VEENDAAAGQEARAFAADHVDVVAGAAADDQQCRAEVLRMIILNSDAVEVKGDGSCIVHSMMKACKDMPGVAWTLGDTAQARGATVAQELLRTDKLLCPWPVR
jgi:hypothetical protein